MKIYHLVRKENWEEAKKSGIYIPESLEEVGFIHCSTKEQVIPTANRRYSGEKNLLLLIIDTNKVKSEIVFEDLNNIGEEHPHIYGKLLINAVTSTHEMKPSDTGKFKLPF